MVDQHISDEANTLFLIDDNSNNWENIHPADLISAVNKISEDFSSNEYAFGAVAQINIERLEAAANLITGWKDQYQLETIMPLPKKHSSEDIDISIGELERHIETANDLVPVIKMQYKIG